MVFGINNQDIIVGELETLENVLSSEANNKPEITEKNYEGWGKEISWLFIVERENKRSYVSIT